MMKYLLTLLGVAFISNSSLATRQCDLCDQSEEDSIEEISMDRAIENPPSYFSKSQLRDLRDQYGIFRPENKKIYIASFLRDETAVYPLGDCTPLQHLSQNAEVFRIFSTYHVSFNDEADSGDALKALDTSPLKVKEIQLFGYELFNENNERRVEHFALFSLASRENGIKTSLEENEIKSLFPNGVNTWLAEQLVRWQPKLAAPPEGETPGSTSTSFIFDLTNEVNFSKMNFCLKN